MKKKKQRKTLKKETKGINFFTVDCTVQSTVKGLKRKKKAYATA
jgi:hypothetical protein